MLQVEFPSTLKKGFSIGNDLLKTASGDLYGYSFRSVIYQNVQKRVRVFKAAILSRYKS